MSDSIGASLVTGLAFLRREARALREPFRLLWRRRQLRGAPSGECGVVVLPGFSTGDLATAPLRRYLRSRGHRTWGWGLGINRGEVGANLPAVVEQVAVRYQQNDERPLVLIGWSLGGVFAREVTRRHPEMVSQVITLATPIWESSNRPDPLDTTARDRTTLARPVTAFHSKRDGVVDWRKSIDDITPNANNIEVGSSHVGITLDPDVWCKIASLLV